MIIQKSNIFRSRIPSLLGLFLMVGLLCPGCPGDSPRPFGLDLGLYDLGKADRSPDRSPDAKRPDRGPDTRLPDLGQKDLSQTLDTKKLVDGPLPDQAVQVFTDVPTTYWAFTYINTLYQKGILAGCSSSPAQFCPSNGLLRGEAAAVVIRALHGENFTYTQTPYFTDVPSTHWAFKYIQKLKETNLTAETGMFKPQDLCLRAQMATLLIKAKEGDSFTYTQTPYFTDVPSTHWSFKYVQKLKDKGISKDNSIFLPDGSLLRDMMAAWVCRTFYGMP